MILEFRFKGLKVKGGVKGTDKGVEKEPPLSALSDLPGGSWQIRKRPVKLAAFPAGAGKYPGGTATGCVQDKAPGRWMAHKFAFKIEKFLLFGRATRGPPRDGKTGTFQFGLGFLGRCLADSAQGGGPRARRWARPISLPRSRLVKVLARTVRSSCDFQDVVVRLVL